MNHISFFVPGVPAPGGSKSAFAMRYGDKSLIIKNLRIAGRKVFGNPVFTLTDAGGKANKVWRKSVAAAGREACKKHLGGILIDSAMWVKFDFIMPRPKCHYGTGRNRDVLKAASPLLHIITPDALKLARSTEDALSGTLWTDDRRIVSESFGKRYAESFEEPGAYIMVEVLT